MEVCLLLPALDSGGDQSALLDQLCEVRTRVREPVVVGEVRRGPHPKIRRCQDEELFFCLVLGRRRRIEDVGGDDSLGKVIHAREVVRSPSRCNLTKTEQVLERELAVVPIPPLTFRPITHLQITRHQWPLGA